MKTNLAGESLFNDGFGVVVVLLREAADIVRRTTFEPNAQRFVDKELNQPTPTSCPGALPMPHAPPTCS